MAHGNALPRTCRETSPRQSTTRHQGPAVDFIRASPYTHPGVARWPTPLQGYRAEVSDEILKEGSVVLTEIEARGALKSRLAEASFKEAVAQETATRATGPAVLVALPRERQPFGEPLTSDPHGGPWQAAACRRQAAARPRESSSALRVASPQRDRPSPRQGSAIGQSVLSKASPIDRADGPRQGIAKDLPRDFAEAIYDETPWPCRRLYVDQLLHPSWCSSLADSLEGRQDLG